MLFVAFAVNESTKLIDRSVGVTDGNSLKGEIRIASEADVHNTPSVALEYLVEGEINYLLIFLKNSLAVNNLFAGILMEMSCKNAVFINNMITSLYISIDKKEVSALRPLFPALDFVKRRYLGKTAELMIMSVGCESVCNELAIVIVVPLAKINGTILCSDTGGVGNGVTVFIGGMLLDRTDYHTGVTIPIILIITANIIVNVYLRTDIAVFKINETVSAEHTHNTAARNVPRAPKSRDLVGSVYGNINKGKLFVSII